MTRLAWRRPAIVRANVPLSEECIEAFDVLTGNGIRRAGDRPPITAVFRTTA
jgi:D-amino-acid dehydrogenase